MNLKETIDLIQNTAVEARAPRVVSIPGDHRQMIITHGGNKEIVGIPAPLRDHAVLNLASLIAFLEHHCTGTAGPLPSVWHSHDRVVALIDDGDRRETVTFELETSKAFRAIREMEKGRTYTQAELVRLLRIDLAGCVDPSLVAVVRTLNFSGSQSTQSTLQHDKSSLGRAVEAKVSGASALPAEFFVTTGIYANHDTEEQPFPIAIDVIFEEQKFRLTPIGDFCHQIVHEAQIGIQQEIIVGLDSLEWGDSGPMVYFGKP